MKDFFTKRTLITALASLIIGVLIASSCEGRGDVVGNKVKTKVKVVERIDTLVVKEKVLSKPKIVYVDVNNTDTIYIKKPDSIPVIKARKYNQKVIGERSEADIEITTTGELIDLKAFVKVKDSIITKEVVEYKVKSNVFMSGGISVNPNQSVRDFNVGIDYNVKSKVLIGIEGGYDLNVNQPFIGFRVGLSL